MSRFTGKWYEWLGVVLGMWLLTLATFGLAYPWAMCIYQRWYTEHTIIDGKRLVFTGTGWGALKALLKAGIWSLLWPPQVPITLAKYAVENTHFEES